MVLTNVEHSNDKINSAQIGFEENGVFTGVILDNINVLFINQDQRIMSSEDQTSDYNKKLLPVIEKMEELTIGYDSNIKQFVINDMNQFKKVYLKYPFKDEIVWTDIDFDIEEEVERTHNQFKHRLGLLKKIDPEKYQKIYNDILND